MSCKNATEPAFPVESITQASRVTWPSSSGNPPYPTELFSMSDSACLAPASAASIAFPPRFNAAIASSFAGMPKFQVERITGLFLLFFNLFDFARIIGDVAPAILAIKNSLLFIIRSFYVFIFKKST